MGPGFFIFFRDIVKGGGRGGIQARFGVFPQSIYFEQEKVQGEPALRWSDIVSPKKEIEIISEGGEKYLIINKPPPTPEQLIELMPKHELEAKIQEIKEVLKITQQEAKIMIKKAAKDELIRAEEIKNQLIQDENILALIIIVSEV